MAATGQDRVALDEPARLAPNDWSSTEVRLLECSSRTFRASCDIAMRIGAWVTLEVPGLGPVKAQISWRRRDQFAAIFAEPLDLARARFMPLNGEVVLARLLKERASAHRKGQAGEEKALRARIAEILPMKPV